MKHALENVTESNWSPEMAAQRRVSRAERRKSRRRLKSWNPIRAWRSTMQAWQDKRRKVKENDDKGRAVVTGRTIFEPLERRAFLKTFGSAAVTALMLSTDLLGSDPARAAQLANYIQFIGIGDGSTDDSGALNGSINTCAAQPAGGAVYIPPPSVSYVIDNIVLKSAVDIIGGSMRQTQFLAKAGSTNSVFVLDVGHVINCRYENFVVNPNGNANQDCFHLRAVSGGSGDGGMWYSIFKNIYVNAFSGYGMWFAGTNNGFNTPHQFITIDSCIIWHPNTTYARSILMTGQCGQFKIQGVCDFSGTGGSTVGYGCELSSEFFNSGAPAGQQHGGVLVGGAQAGGNNTPYNIVFDTATFQNSLTGIYTSNAIDIVVDTCYFENVAQCIVGNTVTYNLAIRGCHFTNCGTTLLPTPVTTAFSTTTTGGSLAPGTYFYRVSALGQFGETLASAQTSQTVPAGTSTNTVTVNWNATFGASNIYQAAGYKIYGRTSGAELLIATVGAVTSYTDTGSITPAGALPSSNTTPVGFVLQMANGSSGSIVECDALTQPDRFINNGSGNGGGQVYARANNLPNGELFLDANMTQPVGGPVAALAFQFQVYINNSTPITSITSQHHVGDRVSFVNQQGGPSATFTAGNNVRLGHWATLTLGNLDTALFELSEIAAGWQLIGTTGTLT